MNNDLVQITNLLINAGGLVVLVAALLSGYVFTKAAVELITKEKDARIADLNQRNGWLTAKVEELAGALKDSVDANKRLAEIWEDRLKRGQ